MSALEKGNRCCNEAVSSLFFVLNHPDIGSGDSEAQVASISAMVELSRRWRLSMTKCGTGIGLPQLGLMGQWKIIAMGR